MTDRPDAARTHLHALAADDWAIVPRDGPWIVTIAGAARTAGIIHELDIAERAYELGRNHADQLPFTGASYEQPIAMSIGTAAAALGRVDEAVEGGVPDPEGAPMKWGDVVFEVDEHGDVVSTWRSWEHLDPAVDVLCPLDARKEWTHCNNSR